MWKWINKSYHNIDDLFDNGSENEDTETPIPLNTETKQNVGVHFHTKKINIGRPQWNYVG